MRADGFLLGEVGYRVSLENGTALFLLLQSEGFAPKALKRCEKTKEISFWLSAATARRFDEAAKNAALEITGRRERGVPFLLGGLRARPGFLAGAVLALALLILSQLFVWDVKILGNERVPTEELTAELQDAGLYCGTFLPALDREGVAFALREGDARVVYAAVNVSGTVARVQIRESEPVPEESVVTPANLVAGRDGVITLPLIFEGECKVTTGEVVRAGQLLASGVMDTQNHGYRLTRAAGQVLARTTHTYTVTVPFESTEKAYNGEEKKDITLFFFNFARKVFKSTGNSTTECDIINNIYQPVLPSGKRLPFGIEVTTAKEYAQVPVRYSATEARAMALSLLEEQLAADSAGRTMLSRVTETRVDGEGITLICTVTCEEDIAKVVEVALK